MDGAPAIKYDRGHFSLGLGLGIGNASTSAAASAVQEAPALARFKSLASAFARATPSAVGVPQAGHAVTAKAEPSSKAANGVKGAEGKKRQEPAPGTNSAGSKQKKQAGQGKSDDAAALSQALQDQQAGEVTEVAQGGDADGGATTAARVPASLEPLGEYIPIPGTAPEPAAGSKAAAVAAGDVDASLREAGRRPYWMQHCSSISSPLLRLHQEIVSLVELLAPTPAEIAARQAAVDQVSEAVKSVWPHASVEVFGSFATGLYVPTSDVDLVVMNTQVDVQTGLKALARVLTSKSVATGLQVIAKAKVPIIKFETVEHGGLAFDISFDVPNGPQAAVLVKEVITEWPMMRPLVLVLKLFLQQRELNEVYSGGIGSYALITMLIAFLQLHNSRRRTPPVPGANKRVKPPASPLEPSLGVLLIDFFRLYGRVINMKEVGISATGGGHYFSKEERSWLAEGREYMLSVEDPKDSTNDICRNSFNIMRVKAAFDFAYQQLAAPAAPDESLLNRILRLGPILASRPRPANPQLLYPRPEKKDKAAGGKEEEAVGKKRRGEVAEEEAGKQKRRKGGEKEEEGVDMEVEEGEEDDGRQQQRSGSSGGKAGKKQRRQQQEEDRGEGRQQQHHHQHHEHGGGRRHEEHRGRGGSSAAEEERGGGHRHGGHEHRHQHHHHHRDQQQQERGYEQQHRRQGQGSNPYYVGVTQGQQFGGGGGFVPGYGGGDSRSSGGNGGGGRRSHRRFD